MRLPIVTRMGDFIMAVGVPATMKPGDVFCINRAGVSKQEQATSLFVQCCAFKTAAGWDAKYLQAVTADEEVALRKLAAGNWRQDP